LVLLSYITAESGGIIPSPKSGGPIHCPPPPAPTPMCSTKTGVPQTHQSVCRCLLELYIVLVRLRQERRWIRVAVIMYLIFG